MMRIVSKRTLLIAGIGGLIFFYGIAAIAYGIYFFWEAKYIGGLLLFIGLISFINDIKSFRKGLEKKTTFENIGMVVIAGLLISQGAGRLYATSTKPYEVSVDFIRSDEKLENEVGKVMSYVHLPYSEINIKNARGNAVFGFLIKGSKKYKEVNIHLKKSNPMGKDPKWKVVSIE